MKRFLKILGITLGSIVGVVVVVVAIAVGVLCHVVFSPNRLTPIVNDVMADYVAVPYSIDEVDLTLLSTFPNAGLRIRGLYVLNPMEGSQSDTLLGVPELVVGLDIQQYLDSQKLSVESIVAENVMLNAYINEAGETNWDHVLSLPADTTEQDTSATVLPFDVKVGELKLTTRQLSFVDRRDSLDIRNLSLSLTGAARADSTLSNIEADVEALTLDWDGLQLVARGTAAMRERIAMNLHVATNDWQIAHVLALLPQQYASLLPKELEVDGVLHADAIIRGEYAENCMPTVDAQLTLADGRGHYDLKVLPYHLTGVEADLTAHVDLNDKEQTYAEINKLCACTMDTKLSATGRVTDILQDGKEIALGNPLCTIDLNTGINLQDLEYFVVSDSVTNSLRGKVTGKVAVAARLNDIMAADLTKVQLQANLKVQKPDIIWQDSTLVQAESLALVLTAPRSNVKGKGILSAECRATVERLSAQIPGMSAQIDGGTLATGAELDTQHKENLPDLRVEFDLGRVIANMDTIHADLVAPKGSVVLTSNQRNKTAPKLQVKLHANAIDANMGQEIAGQTGNIAIEANASYNENGENILLKWNPRLNFDLKQGHAEWKQLPVPIDIPEIKLEYSNHNSRIDTSRIVLGNSDFSLSGHLKNVGGWLGNKAELQGSLLFVSDNTDVDELLNIVNCLSSSQDADSTEDEAAASTTAVTETQATEQESNPFMVPNNVSLVLTTHIRQAEAFGQHLSNLGGKLYVQDGVAILEEIGFVCEAAKLQLTGMYKTPRRDHIFVGIDYHMVDIDLQQLVAMVPQLDTLVPMLRDLRGAAEFHIAAETYVNGKYQLKPSTLRGACAIEGKNLVLLDSETFSTIAKLLMFNKKTENLVDSISAQITLYKDEITVYPFCLSMDNYMVAVGGNHYLDMNFNYHASVLSPIYLGVDVKGNLDDLKIGLATCRYAKDFKPLFHRDVDEKAASLRRMISDSLKKNVVIK